MRVVAEYDVAVYFSLPFPRTTPRTIALNVRDIQRGAPRIERKTGRIPAGRHTSKQIAMRGRKIDHGDRVVRSVGSKYPSPICTKCQGIRSTAEWQAIGGTCRNLLDYLASARIDYRKRIARRIRHNHVRSI